MRVVFTFLCVEACWIVTCKCLLLWCAYYAYIGLGPALFTMLSISLCPLEIMLPWILLSLFSICHGEIYVNCKLEVKRLTNVLTLTFYLPIVQPTKLTWCAMDMTPSSLTMYLSQCTYTKCSSLHHLPLASSQWWWMRWVRLPQSDRQTHTHAIVHSTIVTLLEWVLVEEVW